MVQALIDYKLGLRPTYDPFSSHGADMVVVYFAQHLNNFKAKHKTTSTLSFSRQEEEVPIKSQLLDEIQDELAKSLDFEKTLESLKNNPIRKEVVNEDTIEYDTIIDQHENVMLHYPVVSMLSPNLGLIAGSKALQQRVVTSSRKRAADTLETSWTSSGASAYGSSVMKQ